jgi:hypothetical protein
VVIRSRLMSSAFRAGVFGIALAVFAPVGAALAADPLVIDEATDEPLSTSTAVNGGPGNIIIEDTGSISIDEEGAILTLDSDGNEIDVQADSDLENENRTDAVGILIQPAGANFSGLVTLSGSLVVGDITVNSAQNARNYGIRLGTEAGADAFYGNIEMDPSATILIYGDDSIGIELNRAVRADPGKSRDGDVAIDGTLVVNGENARGVVTRAAIDGLLSFRGNVFTSGSSALTTSDIEPEPGEAVAIGATINGGIYIGGPGSDTDSTTAQAQIRSFGSAAAFRISPTVAGASAVDIVLGVTGELGTTQTVDGVAYSVVNHGVVIGDGLEPGVDGVGMAIGYYLEDEAAGTFEVTLADGIYNSGNIGGSATSSSLLTASAADPAEANATGLIVGRGASVSELNNAGNITANTSGVEGGKATAIEILEGGSLPAIENHRVIRAASATSDASNENVAAYAIVDRSGTLLDIVNYGTIDATASITDSGSETIAIDVSSATANVTIRNVTEADGLIPQISGDILYGSGAANVLHIEGFGLDSNNQPVRATVIGRVLVNREDGGGVNVNIDNGVLRTQETQAVSVTVTGDDDVYGTVDFVLGEIDDPANNAIIDAAGAVTFGEGSRAAFSSLSFLPGGGTFKLISAATGIIFDDYDEAITFTAPYLYTSEFVFDDQLAGTDTLSLVLNRKSASDLGLEGNLATIYEAAAQAAAFDDPFGRGLLSITDQAGVEESLNSLVPSIGVGARALTIAVTDSINGPIGRRQRNLVANPEQGLRFWAQQYYEDLNAATTSASPSYFGSGLGIAGGVEWGDSPNMRYGVSYSYFSGQVTESLPRATKENIALNLLSAYASWRWNNFFVTPQANVGYASYDNQRRVIAGSVVRTAVSDWSAYMGSGGVSSGYVLNLGAFKIIPQVSLDGLYMHETAYTERLGGSGVNLALDSRTTTSVRLFAGVIAQTQFSLDDGIFMPQVIAGWSKELVNDRQTIDASFEATPGSEFALVGPKSASSRLIGGASFTYLFDNWSAGFNYDAAHTSGAFAQSATVSMTSRF